MINDKKLFLEEVLSIFWEPLCLRLLTKGVGSNPSAGTIPAILR